MENKSVPWFAAAAGALVGVAGLARALKPQRITRSTAKDRHISINIGKYEDGTFICGTDVHPDPAIVNKGTNVIWHVSNQCDETITIEWKNFANQFGEDPMRTKPSPLTLLPQHFFHRSGLLKRDARSGPYRYSVVINGVERDPELIMQ